MTRPKVDEHGSVAPPIAGSEVESLTAFLDFHRRLGTTATPTYSGR